MLFHFILTFNIDLLKFTFIDTFILFRPAISKLPSYKDICICMLNIFIKKKLTKYKVTIIIAKAIVKYMLNNTTQRSVAIQEKKSNTQLKSGVWQFLTMVTQSSFSSCAVHRTR